EVLVALSGDLLQEVAEQYISRVAVLPLLAGLEIQRLVAEPGDQLLGSCRRRLGGGIVGERCEVGDSRRMGQQVGKGDFGPARGGVGQILRHHVICPQFASLFQQQDGRRRELLRQRAQAEFGLGRIRNIPFKVGGSIPLVQENLATLGDENRSHELFAVDVRLNDPVHARNVLRACGAMAREEENERPKERSSDGMSHGALLGCCVCNLKGAIVGFKCLLGGGLAMANRPRRAFTCRADPLSGSVGGTPPHLCCAPACASRSRCARKNAHIRLDASILLLVRPTNHSGSGWPPGQVWPPPLMVYSTTAASSAHFVYSRRVTSVATTESSGFVPHRFRRAQLAVKARTP